MGTYLTLTFDLEVERHWYIFNMTFYVEVGQCWYIFNPDL
jgi:hypothetical protein